jgi:DNA modification methylase
MNPINKILQGDSLEVLKTLPNESVDCVITSPPYWGLRDYGTAKWEGGNVECDHKGKPQATRTNIHDRTQPQCNNKPDENVFEIYRDVCGKCGANRIDNQIGLEKTPEEYVAKMVAVFGEVKRVLKKEGTCWLNLGDSYVTAPAGNKTPSGFQQKAKVGTSGGLAQYDINRSKDRTSPRWGGGQMSVKGLPEKNLCGIPWRVAFALQADGWYLRQDIIWAKPNPMPESVTDRCTKSHEYVFLLTKNAKYYFDNEAIREKAIIKEPRPAGVVRDRMFDYDSKEKAMGKRKSGGPIGGVQKQRVFGDKEQLGTYRQDVGNVFIDNGFRNKHSVWTVNTKPFAEAHFATFPEVLIEPMVLAGCPKGGLVLDIFMGAGTTAIVAKKNGRNFLGIELNPKYIEIAERRIAGTSNPLF